MKTEAEKEARLAARTSGLADPRLVVLVGPEPGDDDDAAAWSEAADFAGANRPSLAGKFGAITQDEANDCATRNWPTEDMLLDSPSGVAAIRLGIADGTGPLATALKSLSDTSFLADVPAGGQLRIPANSQTSTEK